MKKFIAMVIFTGIMLALASCGAKTTDNATTNGTTQIISTTAQSTSNDIIKTNYVCFNNKFQKTMILEKSDTESSLYGLLDGNGNTLLNCKYYQLDVLSENRIYAAGDKKTKNGESAGGIVIFDDKGKIINDNKWDYITYKLESNVVGYLPVGIGKKYLETKNDDQEPRYYLVDFNGNKIIDKAYKWISFNDDYKTLTCEELNGEKYIMDFKGNKI